MEIKSVSPAVRGQQLTPEEMAQVAKMAARDREVRAHEAQHLAAAGVLASGVEYIYERGPDGKMYAVGGHVRIVVPASQSPEEALENARTLRAAAHAPADPSGQDLSVAARASQMESSAREGLAEKQAEERQQHAAHQTTRGLDLLA